jgi:hypothetical protein
VINQLIQAEINPNEIADGHVDDAGIDIVGFIIGSEGQRFAGVYRHFPVLGALSASCNASKGE